jgi:hypothetical protein
MSQRITRRQVDGLASTISKNLTSGLYVVAEGRYGYIGIVLYDERGCIRTLSSGHSTREAYNFLRGMFESLLIVGRDVDA